jgi:hypothetical protein
MTYAPGYKWDVFVSFANNDNDAVRSEDRWVSQFVQDLRIGIKNWIGNADKLKVFFEEDSIAANLELPTLLEYARDSAVFLAVVSPSYLRRGWPLEELQAFCGGGNTLGRLFVIECRPAGDYALFPRNLRNVSAASFFIQDKGARVPRPLSAVQDARDWANRISELTKDIGEILEKIKEASSNTVVNYNLAPTKRDSGRLRHGTILLAQTTDDLTEASDDVRRYLTQAGFTVLPRQGIYPQGGEQFRAAFKADLDLSNFYIQLLGSGKSRRDPEYRKAMLGSSSRRQNPPAAFGQN